MTKIDRIVSTLLSSSKPYKRALTGTGELFTAYEKEGKWHVTYDRESRVYTSENVDLKTAIEEAVEQGKKK